MQISRRAIQGERYAALEHVLLSHAMTHPDRSGDHQPDAVASRRAQLFRVHVLAGKAITTTTRYWSMLTGQQLSRQGIAKQLEIVEKITDARR